MVIRSKNTHETSILFYSSPERCVKCNHPIFDFEETPSDWRHKICPLKECNDSIHLKCLQKHLEDHSEKILNTNLMDEFRKNLGINKHLEVDSCILCKRPLPLFYQLCSDCSKI